MSAPLRFRGYFESAAEIVFIRVDLHRDADFIGRTQGFSRFIIRIEIARVRIPFVMQREITGVEIL